MDRLTLKQPALNQPAGKRSDSASDIDSADKKRGIVIHWLDRLVERRIEKVERDIERVVKIAGSSKTH